MINSVKNQRIYAPWEVYKVYLREGQGILEIYLYRAADKADVTADFLLTAKRDRKATQDFERRHSNRAAILPPLNSPPQMF
jgi:transposase-like protein